MAACPDENSWQQFARGGIESATASDLWLHLDNCGACRLVFANLARASTRAPGLERGAMIDRYLVVGTIGRGGMGVVYKAFDPQLDRPVALKLVGTGTEVARARLLREAKLLAQLAHPNVVAGTTRARTATTCSSRWSSSPA